MGTYQLVSEPYDPHFGVYESRLASSSSHGVRRGSPEEQRLPAEGPHYGYGSPHYGYGSPHYGYGSHLRSNTPAMEPPPPPPPTVPDYYGYPQMSVLQFPAQYPQYQQYPSPSQSYANLSTSTWNQQPSPYSPPPPQYMAATSSWYYQSSLISPPQQLYSIPLLPPQYHTASYSFDVMSEVSNLDFDAYLCQLKTKTILRI